MRAGGWQSHMAAGLAAATAVLTALYHRQITGEGSRVDVSEYEALATQLIASFAGHAYGQPAASRDRRETGSVGAIGGVLPCNDGYVAISPREEAQWRQWLEVMGNPDWGDDGTIRNQGGQGGEHLGAVGIAERVEPAVFQVRRRPMGTGSTDTVLPGDTAEDLFTDRHLAHREFFSELKHPVAGTLRYPGAAYRLSNSPASANRRSAPTLGEHNHLLSGLSPVRGATARPQVSGRSPETLRRGSQRAVPANYPSPG